jgi:hypothetical protein
MWAHPKRLQKEGEGSRINNLIKGTTEMRKVK